MINELGVSDVKVNIPRVSQPCGHFVPVDLLLAHSIALGAVPAVDVADFVSSDISSLDF
jgi:hypothetical protein